MSVRSVVRSIPGVGRVAATVRQSRLWYAASALRSFRGIHPRECPICSYRGYFQANGIPPRFDVTCPSCGSHERHRLLALYLKDHPTTGEVIHLAPEPCIVPMAYCAARPCSSPIGSPEAAMWYRVALGRKEAAQKCTA